MEHYHCYIVLRVESCAYDDVGKKVWLLKSAGRKNVKVGSINNLWMRGRGYAITIYRVQRTSNLDDTKHLQAGINRPRPDKKYTYVPGASGAFGSTCLYAKPVTCENFLLSQQLKIAPQNTCFITYKPFYIQRKLFFDF